MCFNLTLLDNYMVYNNSFKFFIKILGKEFPIKILQTSKLIECQYNCIEYSYKNKFIDTDLKQAMKHFFIQAKVDYLNSICNKNSFTTHDLGFFINMFVMRGLTSVPAIDLLNMETNKYEKVQTTFFSDKKVCGILGDQYLGPITSFLFLEDWSKLSAAHKYEKILDYDKNFNLKMISDVNNLAEAIWEKKIYSGGYNNFDSFLFYFKELLHQQYWIHNFGDFKIRTSPNNYTFYSEIYQILYNLNFNFDDKIGKSKILFDSLFFDSNFILENDLTKYKNIKDFKTQLLSWRDKGTIIEFKKNLLFLTFLNEKYIIDDYVEEDLKDSLENVFKNAEEKGVSCFLFFLDNNYINFQRIKVTLKSEKISFYYYIPFYETKSFENDFLLIGIKQDNLDYLNCFFKFFKFVDNQNTIKKHLIGDIEWFQTDLYNHYLYWHEDDLIVVSGYLDFICGGLVALLPKTWQN